MQNLNILHVASLCSLAGWFDSYLARNHEDVFSYDRPCNLHVYLERHLFNGVKQKIYSIFHE